MSEAIGIFFTFTTYGTDLPGDTRGSISRNQPNWRAPTIAPNPAWRDQAKHTMPESAFTLNACDRALVLNSLIQACTHRNWHLHCALVRTTHIHAVCKALYPPNGPSSI